MGARSFLVHGLLAGLIAGLVAFGAASVVGEPTVEAAIALEESPAHDHADPESDPESDAADPATDQEVAVVSRATQSTIGLAAGTVGSGLVLGGLLGLVCAATLGRLGPLGPTASTALTGTVAVVSFALVPFLKYPATPPAAGDPTTIDERTATYFGLVALSVAAAVGAVVLATRLLRSGRSGYAATAVAVVAYLAVVGTAAALLPAAEVAGFPGQLLWEFRVASLLVLLALWASLVLVLTGLVDRQWRAVRADRARRELAASL